jgi:hypothetical protein
MKVERRTIFAHRILSFGPVSWAPNTDQEQPIVHRVIKNVVFKRGEFLDKLRDYALLQKNYVPSK